MEFVVLTIFPEMIDTFLGYGIIKRAVERNIISASSLNIRDFAEGRHKVTDDRPFGGGCGMVMKPEPLAKAIRAAKKKTPKSRTILLTPQGRPFNRDMAYKLSSEDGLILVCGRYEGIDERICLDFIDDEISVGDYVLSGGELAASMIIDAVTRYIPGTLGNSDSAETDSFEEGLIEHGHYTRPRSFEGKDVPEVLLSGNHEDIKKWRFETSLIRTFLKRPDLLEKRDLNNNEIKILKKWYLTIERIMRTRSLSGPDASPGGQ